MRLSVPGHKDLKKIVVLNPKGGCGKSTLTVNLSGYLASRGNSVAIMDFDPQGSSMRWLKQRPGNSAHIQGIAAFDVRSSATRSWQLRVPSNIKYLVVDSPASVPAENLAELTSGAHAILIPVLPSDIDVHAASQLMKDLLPAGCKVEYHEDVLTCFVPIGAAFPAAFVEAVHARDFAVATRRASLEDVFLNLTGRELRE
jgi:cellulose biosynthesis protein BcsQ